ncbi:hypothetical protein ACVWZD_006683 [Streptomyces sp. TE3672]|nr:hypothetical protein EES42_34390 [Streptomyces sp. ADI95-17]
MTAKKGRRRRSISASELLIAMANASPVQQRNAATNPAQ